MAKLNLKASGSNEKIILDYLTNNASESLAERINNGEKNSQTVLELNNARGKKKYTEKGEI